MRRRWFQKKRQCKSNYGENFDVVNPNNVNRVDVNRRITVQFVLKFFSSFHYLKQNQHKKEEEKFENLFFKQKKKKTF